MRVSALQGLVHHFGVGGGMGGEDQDTPFQGLSSKAWMPFHRSNSEGRSPYLA
jgi:hypothetical protein